MEWPSRSVSQGGILHPAKASYSPDTQQFLKLLMEESKMSMMQRKKLNYFLRNGEPLTTRKDTTRSREPEVLIRPTSSKRRSQETILKSGAYVRDKFVPLHPRVDREKEKQRLQDKMAFNEEVAAKKLVDKLKKVEPKADEDENFNRFDELVNEIQEREKWLKDMEELGEGNKYRLIIQQQIQEKLKEMEKLKILTARSN